MNNTTHIILGKGHLPQRAATVAAKHGAELVNYTDPGCGCGWGCESGKCSARKRHWFNIENLGDTHSRNKADEVQTALKAIGIDTYR